MNLGLHVEMPNKRFDLMLPCFNYDITILAFGRLQGFNLCFFIFIFLVIIMKIFCLWQHNTWSKVKYMDSFQVCIIQLS